MRKCLQNKFACAMALVLFLLAVAWNLSTSANGSLSGPIPAVGVHVLVAHGGTFPPDPWECFMLAHGGTFPPDPWEC